MSSGSHASDPNRGTASGHHETGEAHSTIRGYLTGFGLSVVLTVIPFWLVMARPIEDGVVTAVLVVLAAVAQIVVQMIYFLHMDAKSEGGWTLMALIFTFVVLVITIAGSLWVMYHLNNNMMQMDHGVMDLNGPETLQERQMQMEGAAPMNGASGATSPAGGGETNPGQSGMDHGGMGHGNMNH